MKRQIFAVSVPFCLVFAFLTTFSAHADSSTQSDAMDINTYGRIPNTVHYESPAIDAIAESTYSNPLAAGQPLVICGHDNSDSEQSGPVSTLAKNLDPILKPQVTVGITKYTKTGNGTWYQEGLPYQFNLNQASFGLGGVLKLNDKTHVRFGAEDMGLNFNVWAKATPSDANYAACKNDTSKCWNPADWYGTGADYNAYLTLDRDFPTRAGTFVAEVGVTANVDKYHENIPNWYGFPGDTPHDVQVNHSLFHGVYPGFRLGVGYKLDKDTTLMLSMLKYFPSPQAVPPAWGKTMYNLSLQKQF